MRRRIVYYVASSLDGFISGPNEDISGFVTGGSGVDRYLNDLKNFDTVIMGRKTYEFGYKFGLQPGRPAYPHMKHYIFSKTLKLENPDPLVEVKPLNIEEIEAIRSEPGSDIYLCGGGELAGWLLDHDQIDVLKLKLNPFLQGEGVRIFGNSVKQLQFNLVTTERFENGLQIMEYENSNSKWKSP